MERYNQIVIEKVENGFLIYLKTKNEITNMFNGILNKDNFLKQIKTYIAKDEKELLKIIKEQSVNLVNIKDITKLTEKEENLLK